MRLLGIVIAVCLLVGYLAAIRLIVRAPFRALGILVAGMAFHNFVLMVLLRLGTPGILVRLIQAWKEGIILLLLVLAGRIALGRWRSRTLPRLILLDWLFLALTAVVIAYAIVPRLLPGAVTFSQALVGLRSTLLLPLLYLFGRVFRPSGRHDIAWVASVIVGAAAVVGLFGLIELWLIPTATWLTWGVNQLSAWLGYTYHGPKGLPENFFQTAAGGYLLRRMVSTYVSPLGVAYTALLVLPISVAMVVSRSRGPRWPLALSYTAFCLILLSVLFSVTRLAILLSIFELAALSLLLRRRAMAAATLVMAGGAAFILLAYGSVGPLATADLQPVQRGSARHIITLGGPSTTEHSDALAFDFKYVAGHPLGTGLGSSVHRYGPNTGTGESAIFDMFGDMGLLGGLLYLVIYGLVVVIAARASFRIRGDPLFAILPLVASIGGLALLPVTLTSSVWGDFSVTFLFWWAAGAAALSVSGEAQSLRPSAAAAASA